MNFHQNKPLKKKISDNLMVYTYNDFFNDIAIKYECVMNN